MNTTLPLACKLRILEKVCVCVRVCKKWILSWSYIQVCMLDFNDLLWAPVGCSGISMVIKEHVDTHC